MILDLDPASASPAPQVRPWPVDDLPALDPDPFLDRVLREEPVTRISLPYGSGHARLVTRYENVRFVTSDPRFSREEVAGISVTGMAPQAVASQSAGLQYIDPPRHTRLRRVVARAFTARSMARLRPPAEHTAHRMFDGLEQAGPPGDLMEHLRTPFPIAVVCFFLGADEDDWHQRAGNSETLLSKAPDGSERHRTARETTRGRVVDLLQRRRAEPRDDLAGVLARATAAGEITGDEAISPDVLDFGRDGAGHLAFGHGPHFCLAALMARMEAEVMIQAVLDRFPGVRLPVPAAEVEFQREGLIRGPRTLPVTW